MSPIVGGTVSGLILLLISAFSVHGYWHDNEVETERPGDIQRDAPESSTNSMSEEQTRPPLGTCGHGVNCAFQFYEESDPFNFVPTDYIKPPCGDCVDGHECKWSVFAEDSNMVVYKCREKDEATTVSGSATTGAESTTAASTIDPFSGYFGENKTELATGMVHVVLMRHRRGLTPSSCLPFMPCGVQELGNGTVEFIPYCPECPDGYACSPFETESNGWYRAYTCQQVETTAAPSETEVVPDHSGVQRRSGSMAGIHEL